jgi:SSS family solute:Na+ symporter
MMAANFWRALWAWLISTGVATAISAFTKKRPQEELVGLVRSLTPKTVMEGISLYKKPAFWASITLVIFIILNILFW